MSGSVRLSTAPGTWGVEPGFDAAQPPWELVLDEVAAAGFDGIELGPYGYLPTNPERLVAELESRGLELSAGFVMEPLHDPTQSARILRRARETCELLAAAGGEKLVVIGSLVPERSATAGRAGAASSLEGDERAVFLRTLSAVMVHASDVGLIPALHPHAGTFVEFAHEIDRVLDEAGGGLALCIDTGHCRYSGVDASSLLDRHAGRVAHVHMKDVRGEVLRDVLGRELSFEQAVAAGVFCALGDGNADLQRFVDELARIGYCGWVTYEQDRVASDHPRARGDAERSRAHLNSLGLREPRHLSSR